MRLFTLLMAFSAQNAPSVEEAVRLLDAGRMTEAQQVLSQLDSNAPGVAHTAGVLYFRLHDYSKAIESLNRAVQKESKSSPGFRQSAFFLGESYYLSAHMPE